MLVLSYRHDRGNWYYAQKDFYVYLYICIYICDSCCYPQATLFPVFIPPSRAPIRTALAPFFHFPIPRHDLVLPRDGMLISSKRTVQKLEKLGNNNYLFLFFLLIIHSSAWYCAKSSPLSPSSYARGFFLVQHDGPFQNVILDRSASKVRFKNPRYYGSSRPGHDLCTQHTGSSVAVGGACPFSRYFILCRGSLLL